MIAISQHFIRFQIKLPLSYRVPICDLRDLPPPFFLSYFPTVKILNAGFCPPPHTSMVAVEQRDEAERRGERSEARFAGSGPNFTRVFHLPKYKERKIWDGKVFMISSVKGIFRSFYWISGKLFPI